jgi:hypothetical protein
VDSAGVASAWVAYATNSEDAADFRVSQPPAVPGSRGQNQANGTTAIALGGYATATSVVFKGTVTDPDAGQLAKLQVEAKPLGTAFTGTPTCQSVLVSSGTAASCTATGLPRGTSYHWQTRTVDSGGLASAWVSYATNAEDAADFKVNRLPATPTLVGQFQSDGSTAISLGGYAASTTVVFRGTVTDPDAGQPVKLQVEAKPVGTAFTGTPTCESSLVTSGTAASCTATGLTRGTSYHWQLRAVDRLGAASAWASYATNAETAADFSVAAGNFSLADLQGTWYMTSGFDYASANDGFWAFGQWRVDANGAITGGQMLGSGGDTDEIAAGYLTLTDEETGTFTGSFHFTYGGVVTIQHLNLAVGKTHFGAVGTDTWQSRWLAVGTKAGGSFSPADLQGTWYVANFADAGDSAPNDPFWSWSTMTIGASGNIMSGSVVDSDGDTDVTFIGGSLPMDGAGVITNGTVIFAKATPYQEGSVSLPRGKLDPGRNVLTLVINDGGGLFGSIVAIKAGGSFSQADLAGTWSVFARGDDIATNDPFAAAGTLEVAADGTITGGGFRQEDGSIDPVTSGRVTLDGSGLISGSWLMPIGGTVTISHGKLDANKRTFNALGTTVSDETQLWMGLGLKQ